MWRDWKEMFLSRLLTNMLLCVQNVFGLKVHLGKLPSQQHMYERDALKKKSSAVRRSRDWLNCKECRNSVNFKIKRAKGLCYNNAFQVNAGEPRASWRVVNDLLIFMQENVPTNSNVNEMKMNGHSIVDLQE